MRRSVLLIVLLFFVIGSFGRTENLCAFVAEVRWPDSFGGQGGTGIIHLHSAKYECGRSRIYLEKLTYVTHYTYCIHFLREQTFFKYYL